MRPRPWPWGAAPAPLDPAAAPVVWALDLDACPVDEGLAPDERRRAAALLRPADRRRFAASRVALRHVLGAYVGARPETLALQVRPGGKPALPGGPAFSLSRSGRHLLVAVHACDAVGVDVEVVAPVEAAVADRVLTGRERTAVAAAADPTAAFIHAWTLKEAVLKATGEGLARPMAEVDLALDADPLALRAVPTPYPAPDRWRLWSWADGSAAGALAWVPGRADDSGTPGDGPATRSS